MAVAPFINPNSSAAGKYYPASNWNLRSIREIRAAIVAANAETELLRVHLCDGQESAAASRTNSSQVEGI